ncbi:MAG TPA: hypothetical protein VGJ87_21460 [Roseiflexaceae bacterium]|jgi:hypothetical protein
MVELIPLELRAKIPQLGEASEQEDPMVWVKLTCEPAGWTWYIIAADWLSTDAIFYGYVVGWDEELTHFNQSDLELQSAQWDYPIVWDEGFIPTRLSAVQAAEHGERKFPLGQLAITPGTLAALAVNQQTSSIFLRRHWRGDWGELDAEDVQENEHSLANGFRLLSVYTLKDGTRIWIITEADRSATTIVLPSEY